MMLTDYPGMVPEMYSDLGFRTEDYDLSQNALMWPASDISAWSLLAELPPFSIQRQGLPSESVGPGVMPSFITPESPNITAWQDMNISGGYPAPMGTAPACSQSLPLVNNWAGGYMPRGGTLIDWLEQNPGLALIGGLLMLAAGGVLSREL